MSSPRIPEASSTSICVGTEPIPEASEKIGLNERKTEIASPSSDPVIYFSENEKIKDLITSASVPAYEKSSPDYQYSQVGGNRGYVGLPVYQQREIRNVGRPQGPQDLSQTPPPYRRNTSDVVLDAFDTVKIRNNFVRKVYMILSVQLLITFGSVVIASYQKDVRDFLKGDRIIFTISYALFIVIMLILTCCQYARRIFPWNVALLFLLTISVSYSLASLSTMLNPEIVMISLGITTIAVIAISLLAWQAKFDITRCGVVLTVAIFITLLYGLVAVYILSSPSKVHQLIYALATLVICVVLMFDTQQILGGRRIQLSPDEYVFGALTLYIDIILLYILLQLLKIFRYYFN